jgi:hypothetical protein
VAAAVMRDGALRRTVAAASEGARRLPMSNQQCGRRADQLRGLVGSSVRQLFLLLDTAAQWSHAQNVKHVEDTKIELLGPSYSRFEELASEGRHLEHLHSYYSSSDCLNLSSHTAGTLPMHTDSGLFVAMTTGFVKGIGGTSQDVNLHLQLPSGVVVRAETDDDSLLILVGEGAAEWLLPVLGSPLRAMPHALVGSGLGCSPDNRRWTRSWYGMMILPPPNALVPAVDSNEKEKLIPYRDYREMELRLAAEVSADRLPTGCISSRWDRFASNGLQKRLLSNELCTRSDGSNGIMCWTQCQSVNELPCGKFRSMKYNARTVVILIALF